MNQGEVVTFSIRRIAVDDLPEIFAVRLSARENGVSMEDLVEYNITPESLALAMTKDVRGWLVETEGRIAGFAMGDSSTGEVLVLSVLPECEGRGIGRAVLQEVEDWLFAAGNDKVWLYTSAEPNFRAYQLYLHLGWQTTGELEEDEELLVKFESNR